MKRVFWSVLLVAFLTSTSAADVGELLEWQKRGDGGAYVSSGFHDWRTVSKYRRHPGLHAGYDIAMLAGSPVRTPWEGVVVSITPWYGYEMGITVKLDNGWEATFGHLTSGVTVGQRLNSGDVVGNVVVDHVDVKMRDHMGRFVDFDQHPPSVKKSQSVATKLQRPELADAFSRYNKLTDKVALVEFKVKNGLEPPRSLESSLKELKALEPLALEYAKRSGLELSTRVEFQPKVEKSGRPATDMLLELSER